LRRYLRGQGAKGIDQRGHQDLRAGLSNAECPLETVREDGSLGLRTRVPPSVPKQVGQRARKFLEANLLEACTRDTLWETLGYSEGRRRLR
jgi:hypothetical protein